MNVRKASVSRILTLLILIFFSLAIVSCRFSPKVPPATDPDTGTINPDPAEPEEPEISTGRQFIISFPEGVTATKRGKAFQSGSMAYEEETITLTASGLEEGWDVTGWVLYQHGKYIRTFENSTSKEWKYKVCADDAYYDGEIKLNFFERSLAVPVEVRITETETVSGFLLEQGMPHNPTVSEFEDYFDRFISNPILAEPEKSNDLNLINIEFKPYDEKSIDLFSMFKGAPDVRLYYYANGFGWFAQKDILPIEDDGIDTWTFDISIKTDPADGLKKFYLKDKIDNDRNNSSKEEQKNLPNPRIFVIQGNRWYSINLLLLSQVQVDYIDNNAEVEAEITRLKNTIFKDLESDFDKVLAVHDYITDNVTWGRIPGRFLDAQTAYGALIQKTCVCEGYARAFMQIMKELKVDSKVIIGNGGTHAWNIVKVDGKWYQIDLTWDDYDGFNGISHHYGNFLKSDATMIATNHYSFPRPEPCDEDYPLPWEKKTD